MVPLTILTVYRVPLAAVAEKLLFAALAAFRVDQRHEIFDLNREQLVSGIEAVQAAFDPLRAMNPDLVEVSNVQEEPRLSSTSATQAKKQQILDRKQKKMEKLQAEEQALQDKAKKFEQEVDDFLEVACERGRGYKVPSQTLTNSFCEYHKRINVSAVAFYAALKEKGFTKKSIWFDSKTTHGFSGIRLKQKAQL